MNVQNKKIIFISILAILLLIFVVVGLSFFFLVQNSNKKTSIQFIVNPKDAEYVISGNIYTGSKTIDLFPGKYRVVFSKKLYLDETTDITVIGGEEQIIKTTLKPIDTSAVKYDSLTTKEQETIDTIDDKQVEMDLKNLYKKYPLMEHLPHYTPRYRIDINYITPASEPSLLITLVLGENTDNKDTYTNEANAWLQSIDQNYSEMRPEYVVE